MNFCRRKTFLNALRSAVLVLVITQILVVCAIIFFQEGTHNHTSYTNTKINVDHGVAIMLLSRRGSFDVLAAIRETWARGHTGVFFIVGDKTCLVPPVYRKSPLSCESNGTSVPFHYQYSYNKVIDLEEASLAAEAKAHSELIFVPMVDAYSALPHKLKLAYNWVLEHTDAKWLVKIDEDNVARIPNLVKLLSIHNSTDFVVMGRIFRYAKVRKTGKWGEPDYEQPIYPPYPDGAVGHAVTRGVAEAVVSYNGYEYWCEDTSLGIWLDEMKIPVIWDNVYPKHFSINGDCTNSRASITGHNIRPSDMRRCFNSNSS